MEKGFTLADVERLEVNAFKNEFRGLFVECIYTFEYGQKLAHLPIAKCILKSKSGMREFLTNILTEKEYSSLRKISCCIYNAQILKGKMPEWYDECKGKFYLSGLY